MSDKVLRTRRIPNEDRLEAIIALLRAEVKAWRNAETSHYLTDYMDENDDYSHAREVKKAMEQTDAAGALEGK